MAKRKTAAKRTRTAKSKTAAKRTRTAKSKRELIDTQKDKRYVRRGSSGKFRESDDVGRSLKTDRQQKARRTVKSGQGDRGDR
jgi:hypothetical protein